MKKQIIFICGLFLLALVACKKDALTLTENDVKEQHVGNGGFRTATENPFDEVGKMHNAHLDDYYAQEYNTEPTVAGTVTFFTNLEIETFIEESEYPFVELVIDKSLHIDAFIQNHWMSSLAKSYAFEMLTLIRTNQVEGLLELENSVIEDKENFEAVYEHDALLMAIAVARHSCAYWDENLDDWFVGEGTPSPGDMNVVAEADAATALGVAFSCVAGLATPPTGMTVAAFAAASGAVASAATAIAVGGSWVLGQVGANGGWW